MAIQTTEAQLEAVQEAITAVLAGQSWTMGGVTYTRANLSALEARESRLKKLYNRENKTRGTMKTVNLDGMGYS